MSRPNGEVGDAQHSFHKYQFWSPWETESLGYLYSIIFMPFHGGNDSMNFTFVDGHGELIDCRDIPINQEPEPLSGDPDWDSKGISLRKDYQGPYMRWGSILSVWAAHCRATESRVGVRLTPIGAVPRESGPVDFLGNARSHDCIQTSRPSAPRSTANRNGFGSSQSGDGNLLGQPVQGTW